jgi:hypothetical protein
MGLPCATNAVSYLRSLPHGQFFVFQTSLFHSSVVALLRSDLQLQETFRNQYFHSDLVPFAVARCLVRSIATCGQSSATTPPDASWLTNRILESGHSCGILRTTSISVNSRHNDDSRCASEVVLTEEDGMKTTCAVNLHNALPFLRIDWGDELPD